MPIWSGLGKGVDELMSRLDDKSHFFKDMKLTVNVKQKVWESTR